MGSGLDIARESGDIILLNNDLSNIPLSILIGRSTISKIKQNIGGGGMERMIVYPALLWAIGLSVYLMSE